MELNKIYTFNDGGRSESKRPKQKNDCVVRAISIALGQGYDFTYNQLTTRGRLCSRSTPKKIWQPFLDLRRDMVKFSFPAKAGVPRVNLYDFCESFPDGRFVVQMAKHLTAVVDGVVQDDFEPRFNKCVYAAWGKKS